MTKMKCSSSRTHKASGMGSPIMRDSGRALVNETCNDPTSTLIRNQGRNSSLIFFHIPHSFFPAGYLIKTWARPAGSKKKKKKKK